MLHPRSLWLACLLGPWAVACTEGPGEEGCTLEYVPGVIVDVEDPAGEPIPAATVTYSDEDEADQACGELGRFQCAGLGRITVRAEAPGYEPAEETVDVELSEDGCHPATERVTLVLVPADGGTSGGTEGS